MRRKPCNKYILSKGDNFMSCENQWCLYNDEECCTVESIEINSYGMCASSIMMHFNNDVMREEKARQLEALNS